MKTRIGAVLLAVSWSVQSLAADAVKLETEEQKVGYTIGTQIGEDLKRSGVTLDVNTLAQGIKDAIAGTKPALSEADMEKTMEGLQKKQMEAQAEMANKNKKEGDDFLAANKKKEGITALPSGVQYKVLKKGTGAKPAATDTVSVHYKGTLINGTEFDSSYSRGEPATFPVNGVIKGWQEILPLMPVGSKWQVFIPSDSAYGERGAPPQINPNSTLIFEIELLDIKKAS